MATHICLVGKSISQKTAFGEFAVARWPGGQSHLSSRKIYNISEERLQALRVRRQRLDQLCIPLRYLVATAATLATDSSVSLKCTSEGRCFLAPLRRGQPFGRASVPKICATSLREMAEGVVFQCHKPRRSCKRSRGARWLLR